MIINHSFRFIFIHTPKAAGTSVTSKLSEFTRYCDQEIGNRNPAMMRYFANRFGLRKHSTAAHVRPIVGEDVWREYFTFAFVRDPYARLVSAYTFLCKWENCPEAARKELDKLDTAQKFLDSEYWSASPGPDNIFVPQTHWVCENSKSRTPLVDFVGRTERLDQDMTRILQRIEGKDSGTDAAVPALNVSTRARPDVDWTPELVARVQRVYAPDFEAFYPEAVPPAPE